MVLNQFTLRSFLLRALKKIVLTCFITSLFVIPTVQAKEQYTFKFATLVPANTAWMKEIERWADQIYKESDGRLKFKIYPGGVMGDEPDVLRKIRSHQLQGKPLPRPLVYHLFPCPLLMSMLN